MGIKQPAVCPAVLIVESETISRHLLSEVLADSGYCVIEAGDPFEGESLFQAEAQIDLLVTSQGKDWTVKGTQLVQSLRSRQPALPAIIMTGGGPVAREADVVVIHKPFSMVRFLQVVAAMLACSTSNGKTVN